MSYYDRPVSSGYYSFTNREKMHKAKMDAIENIPTAHNRIREETGSKAEVDYIVAHRRSIKTPYKVGDKVFYTVKENYGTKKWPWIVVKVYSGYINKITEKTYLIGYTYDKSGKYGTRISHEYVLARTK